MPMRTVISSLSRTIACSAPARHPARSRNRLRMKLDRRPSLSELSTALAEIPPAGFHGLGAWVEHHLSHNDGAASTVLAECLELPRSIVNALFEFGAIYSCPVPPSIPEEAKVSPTERARLQEAASARAEGSRPKDTRLTTPVRLSSLDKYCEKHTYFRVHLSPKRFPVFHEIRWMDRLIEDAAEYMVLNKPPGLPTVPTVDNLKESVMSGAALCLRHQRLELDATDDEKPTPSAIEPKLYVTTRLDHATEGLVILGKNPEFVRNYNELCVRNPSKAVKKLYRALTSIELPLGLMEHRVRIKCRIPGSPYFTLVVDGHCKHMKADEGAASEPTSPPASTTPDLASGARAAVKVCKLNVHSSRYVKLARQGQQHLGVESAWESTIELITGRTHQIRAQLSAIGAPILGDCLYRALADENLRYQLAIGYPLVTSYDDRTGERLLCEAEGNIGLQAFRLEFMENDLFPCFSTKVFDAGDPWWAT